MSKNNLYILACIIIVSIPAILPLFHEGFFVTDDGDWMIIRFSAFYSALRDGQLPVRFLHTLNSGYGYPVSTFLYPGFMYLGIPIQIITSNFIITIKIISGLSLVSSAIFTYLWLNKIFPKTASFLGAIVSLYLPYHLYDLYVRGSIGEILALAWVPFILWMIERKSIFLIAIGITMLILSHNTLALIFLPIIIFYSTIKIINLQSGRKQEAFAFLSVVTLGIAMSAFFTIPAIIELTYTNFFKTPVSNPLMYFSDIKIVGPISIFMTAISFIFYLYKQNKIKNYIYILILFFIISCLAIFLSSEISTFIWNIIPSAWIQFPFRMLSILIISIPFLTAFIFSHIKGILKPVLTILIVVMLYNSTSQLLTKIEFTDKPESFYFTNQATTTVKDEYMPVWVSAKPTQRPDNKVEIISGEGLVNNTSYNNNKITFNADIKEKSTIQINTIYWPGWNIKINDETGKPNYTNNLGVMQITLPVGNHKISAHFSETPLRATADIISILSFVYLIILSRTKKQKNV